MTNEDIQNRLLTISYQAHQSSSYVNLREWAAEEGIEEQKAWNCLDILGEQNLVKCVAAGAVGLSTGGVLFAEEKGLAPSELVSQNRQARFKILDALAGIREEHGLRAWPSYQQVMEQSGLDWETFDPNQDVLTGLGFIEWPVTQLLTITSSGMSQALTWRSQVKHLEKYKELRDEEDLTPQARGHQLELLLRDVLVFEGWDVETNVRAPGEENDLILNRELDYYIMECKWVKETTQPYLLSILRDRVSARIGTRGLFVSMAGFTPEAIKDTADRLEKAIILLFGPKDIEAIVSHRSQFSELLKAKFHAAVTRRAMLIDGEQYSR